MWFDPIRAQTHYLPHTRHAHAHTNTPPMVGWFGLLLWYLKPLSTIFQLYHGGQLIGGGKRRTWRKPPSCRKSLTKLYYIMLQTLTWAGIEATTSVVIGTDYIGGCKSNTTWSCLIYIYILMKRQKLLYIMKDFFLETNSFHKLLWSAKSIIWDYHGMDINMESCGKASLS